LYEVRRSSGCMRLLTRQVDVARVDAFIADARTDVVRLQLRHLDDLRAILDWSHWAVCAKSGERRSGEHQLWRGARYRGAIHIRHRIIPHSRGSSASKVRRPHVAAAFLRLAKRRGCISTASTASTTARHDGGNNTAQRSLAEEVRRVMQGWLSHCALVSPQATQ
jgi:hypothetical protein